MPGLLLTTTLYDDTGSLAFLDLSRPARSSPSRSRELRHEGVGELDRLDHLDGRSLRADVQHRRLLVGVCRYLRRGGADVPDRPRARRRGRARRRRAPRAPLRRGEWPLRRGVLHGDDADAAPRPAGRRRAADDVDARASARRRSRDPLLPARTRRSSRTTACASPHGSTCRRPSSATTARGRSSTTCTAARRARSARTSRGSRCRSSRS